jgi:hypothetical protein
MIFKEFKYNKESGELVVDTSPINWKDGCNLTLKVRRGRTIHAAARAPTTTAGPLPPARRCSTRSSRTCGLRDGGGWERGGGDLASRRGCGRGGGGARRPRRAARRRRARASATPRRTATSRASSAGEPPRPHRRLAARFGHGPLLHPSSPGPGGRTEAVSQSWRRAARVCYADALPTSAQRACVAASAQHASAHRVREVPSRSALAGGGRLLGSAAVGKGPAGGVLAGRAPRV